ncbi:uncharacterized protein LOC132870783 [Neoarius graeffei]|uniref:uncharacterized protein LOC132870783 n=1 Tax=Neoarius graeffei TaxID=443677 RepID=UPI00298BF52A|nr:uncharacterized protein LOC132870783 [Neoarius graeffei]
MWVVSVNCLLLCVSVDMAYSAVSNQSGTEQGDTLLFCKHNGKVIWSKSVDGGRGDILTAKNGEITIKHKPDPDNRYSVLSDLSLLIQNLFQSDSGIYYCNTVPVVNLTVSPLKVTSLQRASVRGTHPHRRLRQEQPAPERFTVKMELFKTTFTTPVSKIIKDLQISVLQISLPTPERCKRLAKQWFHNLGTESISEGNTPTQTTQTRTTSTGEIHGENGAFQNNIHNTSVEDHQGSSDISTPENISEGNTSTPTTQTRTTSIGETHSENGASQNTIHNTNIDKDKGSSDIRTTESVSEENTSTQMTWTRITSTRVTHGGNGTSQNNTHKTSLEDHQGASDYRTSECVVIIVSVLVGVTVVTIFAALLLWRCFCKKKTAKAKETDHIYESIGDVTQAAPENHYESIYLLAGDPAIVNQGKIRHNPYRLS